MQGIVLKGVDSTYDWTPMRRSLVAGRLPDVSDTVRHKEVLLSRAVADRMEADVGDPIEMLFVQNPPRRDRFRVSGIYDTGFGELDRVLALTDLRNVQRLNGWDSTQVSGFELRTTDFSHLDRFTDDVYRAVVEHQRTDRDEPLPGDERPDAVSDDFRLARRAQRQRGRDHYRDAAGRAVQHDRRAADHSARTDAG